MKNYKKILTWIIIGVILIGGGVFLVWHLSTEKSLELISPQQGEELRAGQTYQIRWKSRNIGEVGIILIKDKEPRESEWLGENLSGRKGKYDWQIFVWQEPRQDYRIAIFEYPWQEGNKIDYSDDVFTILGPQFASCDSLSIEEEWPFLPSDFPNLRKVFITKNSFKGNLEGLEGADQKCQSEAENQKFEGTWKAFLGDNTTFAMDRLNLEGIFVEAKTSALLPEGKTCHRLLGRNVEEFFKKLSDPLIFNQEKFEEEFLNNLSNLWLGRINKESKRNCASIFTRDPHRDLALNYSFTTTCQNWEVSEEKVPGYPPTPDEKIGFPICHTVPGGEEINAVALAGLSSGVIEKDNVQFLTLSAAKTCNTPQKLLCIQQ